MFPISLPFLTRSHLLHTTPPFYYCELLSPEITSASKQYPYIISSYHKELMLQSRSSDIIHLIFFKAISFMVLIFVFHTYINNNINFSLYQFSICFKINNIIIMDIEVNHKNNKKLRKKLSIIFLCFTISKIIPFAKFQVTFWYIILILFKILLHMINNISLFLLILFFVTLFISIFNLFKKSNYIN